MKKDHSQASEDTNSAVTADDQSGVRLDISEDNGEAGQQDKAAVNAELQTLRDKLIKAEAERDSYKDQLLRSLADFQNFRKRVEADKQTIRLSAKEAFAVDLIGVLDNYERTMEALEAGAKIESIVEGVQMVDRQFRQVLESHGVKRISSEGQPFDPEIHEAVTVEQSDEHPEDTVISELQPGYRIDSKVIRPARVKVSKKG